ncbi:MAG: hypothetical protein K2F85_00425, partial [Helicobacter sp.]|nr:hypothetical protein [Helicobacter sp.]
ILIKKHLQSIAKEHLNLVLLYRISFVSLLKVHAPFALLLSFGVQEFEGLWRFGMSENMEDIRQFAEVHFLDYEAAFLWGGLKRCAEIIRETIDDAKIINELITARLVKSHGENTQGLWQELESSNVRCLILKFAINGATNCQIAPMVEVGEKTNGLIPDLVNGKCLILDGLKYQSVKEMLLIYMEL